MIGNNVTGPGADAVDDNEGMTLSEVLSTLRQHIKLLTLAPLAAGLIAIVVTSLIAPTFTAVTTFMPPQQGQSAAASALASLGSLAGLAGAATGVRSPGEQYVALMQSVTVSDRIINEFNLMEVYKSKFRTDARSILANSVRITLGKKDGFITVEVDDKIPQRAAEIANKYVDELRHITGSLAVGEAQQRRAFFEQQLAQSRDRLIKAQQALLASGFNPDALKAEPRTAADTYANLRAQVTATEVRLQVLRGSYADGTSEVRQQQAALMALREQLARIEQPSNTTSGPDYVGKYREFKYQETLFDLYARQFELARLDESREGGLIQVVDPASPPERKSKPKRTVIASMTTIGTLISLAVFVLLRQSLRTD